MDAALYAARRLAAAEGVMPWFWFDPDYGYQATFRQLENVAALGAILVSGDELVADARKRYLALHYRGDTMPRWVCEGAQVRVKAVAGVRKVGIGTTTGRSAGDDRAWPKEIGTVHRREGNGWWEWKLVFERGRECSLEGILYALAHVRPPKA